MKCEDEFTEYSPASVSEQVTDKIFEQNRKIIDPKLSFVGLKYSLLFLCSLLVSLTICPQRGVGLYKGSMGLVHHLLHQSEVLCGLYCGLMFFLTTHVLSFLLLSHFERLKMINRLSFLPVLALSSFFGLSMTSYFSNLNVSTYYFISWAAVVMIPYFLFNRIYSLKFS